MVDQFTIARAKKLLTDWKQNHGRDISMAELMAQGFKENDIDDLVRQSVFIKYQVTAKGGRTENRFKLATNWYNLKS